MAEIFNFKKGATENLGLRWLGSTQTNSRARYGAITEITGGGKYAYTLRQADVDSYRGAFPGNSPQDFADYWNNPDNFLFRNYFITTISNYIYQVYNAPYERNMREGDCIVIPSGLSINSLYYYNVYQYVDLKKSSKINIQRVPCF